MLSEPTTPDPAVPAAPDAPGLFADGFARHRDEHYEAVVRCDRSLDEEVAVLTIDYTCAGFGYTFRGITLDYAQARLVLDAIESHRTHVLDGEESEDAAPVVEALRRLIDAG